MKAKIGEVEFEITSIEDIRLILEYNKPKPIVEKPKSIVLAIEKPKKNSNRKKFWTKEDDDFLDKNLNKLSYNEIAKYLGRTAAGVRGRIIYKYALSAPVNDFDNKVKKYHDMGKSVEAISKLMSAKRGLVYKSLRKFRQQPAAVSQEIILEKIKEMKLFTPADLTAIRDLVVSCALNKSKLSANDIATIGYKNDGVFRQFAVSLYNMQPIMGRKVSIENNDIVFG